MKKIVFIPILLLLASCGNVFTKQKPISVKTSDYFISFGLSEPKAYSFILTNESLKNIYYADHYTTKNIFCEAQGDFNISGFIYVDYEVENIVGYASPISLSICQKDQPNNCQISSKELANIAKEFQCHFEFSGLLRFDKKISQTFIIKTDGLLNAPVMDTSADFNKIIQQEAYKASLRNIS